MNVDKVMLAMQAIENDRNIPKEIVIDALKDSLAKAYRRQIGVPDALVDVVISEESGDIKLYHKYKIVEEVMDDELEVGIHELDDDNVELVVGDYYQIEQPIDSLGRAAAILAKNVIKQRIREAEKQGIYDEYIDQLGEMIFAMVESVEDKFVVLNLGKSLAVMPRAAQIEGEIYQEGQTLKVVITDVNKDAKGAPILVSRADAMLVRRLFEAEVPEIFDGQVEIKAIAREAGERTKIAVYSHDPDIDPIGACIGPRGTRVQEVIEELQGEKIDIFEWSNDVDQLIKSSLAPAEVLYVLPTDDERSVIVVVDDDQLSLAIGRGGKNAKLAVKLINKKIDIKSLSDIKASGIDYESIALANQPTILVEEEVEEVIEPIFEEVDTQGYDIVEEEVEVEDVVEETVVEESVAEVTTTAKKAQQITLDKDAEKVETTKVEETAPKVERVVKDEYVSKFEKLADPTIALQKIAKQEEAAARRRARYEDRNKKDEEVDLSDLEYEIAPEYSDEEMAEIKAQEEELDNSWYEDEIDFEDFEDYYED